MNILKQTPQMLVIGTPASALLLVRLIGLAISFPGLLTLAIYVLSGAADYSSLTCQRSRPGDRQCRFLRLSPVRLFVYRFPITAIQATSLQKQPQRTLVGGRSGSHAPTARYVLFIVLQSGEKLLGYDYFEQPPADHIAQAMRQFLSDEVNPDAA